AQFTESLVASAAFFMIAVTFLLYSFYIMREQTRLTRLLDAVDRKVRGTLMKIERPGIPFQGAFWFYFSCGLVFLLFPKNIAITACLILAISDSLATLVGHHLGRKKFLGNKTLEGTLVFFFSALLIGWVLIPQAALLAALAATIGELLPELAPSLRRRGLLDDNMLIPILAALAFLLAG
ncbi:MAG: hypothetical protein ISS93_02780, partial [Candidatus Aenigmarchaeota archaeon]|nr:hypothetical protein [Candidatus Aenigmarchaeota archaeon]